MHKTDGTTRQLTEFDLRIRMRTDASPDEAARGLREILKRLLRSHGAVCTRLFPVKQEGTI